MNWFEIHTKTLGASALIYFNNTHRSPPLPWILHQLLPCTIETLKYYKIHSTLFLNIFYDVSPLENGYHLSGRWKAAQEMPTSSPESDGQYIISPPHPSTNTRNKSYAMNILFVTNQVFITYLLEYKEQIKLTTLTNDFTQVSVRISKFIRKGFTTIKTYHSHSNSFHHSNIRFLTCPERP